MRLLFITDHESVFQAFKTVIEVLSDAEVFLITPKDNLADLVREDDIFVVEGDEKTISKWLWDVIRVKYLNPVIVLGNVAEKTFLKKNPAFRDRLSRYHRYLEPPHLINRFLEAINQVKPLYDEDTRQIIFDRYGSPYVEDKLFRLIDHDLKLFDKNKDITVLEEAVKYAGELNNSDLQEKLRQAIQFRENDEMDSLRRLKAEVLQFLKEGTEK